MKDWIEVGGILLLCFVVGIFGLLLVVLCYAFVGAVWGALGAGVYLAFKWLVGLAML